MILRIGLKTAWDNTECTPTLEPIINPSSGISAAFINLVVGGVTLFDAYIDTLSTTVPVTGYCFDDNGESITYSILRVVDVVGNRTILRVDLGLINSWDSANVALTVTDGSVIHYHTYYNVFTVYGYDLGNEGLSAQNPMFDIWMIIDGGTYLYPSHFIAYRRPFTDQINVYHATSYMSGDVSYYEDTTFIVEDINTIICHREDINIVQHYGNCTSTITVEQFHFLPRFVIQHSCTDCTTDCVSLLETPTITLHMTYYMYITSRYENDIRRYWHDNQSSTITVYDQNGDIVQTDTIIQYMPDIYVSTGLPVDQAVTYTPPNVGNITIRGCVDISGVYERIYEDNGQIVADDYYMILNDATLTGADFSNLSVSANPNTENTVLKADNAIVPTDWGTNGQLINIIVEGDLTVGTYYQILFLGSGADFDNLTGHVSVVGDIFCVVTGIVAPTSWGLVAPDAWSPEFVGGAVVEVEPVLVCCTDTILEGCYPFEVINTACDAIRITNYDPSETVVYTIYILDESGWTSTGITDTLTIYPTTGYYEEIEDLEDGVYKIEIVTGGSTYNQILFITCDVEECLLGFINKLICCNPDTNCDDCEGDDCKKKDYYDFNAFSLLERTLFGLLNYYEEYGYVYDNTDIIAQISRLRDIDTLLTKARNYCMECDEPCTDCN